MVSPTATRPHHAVVDETHCTMELRPGARIFSRSPSPKGPISALLPRIAKSGWEGPESRPITHPGINVPGRRPTVEFRAWPALALFFVRWRATRWYRRNCDALPSKEVTTPAVLPAVPYRGVRSRQRRGAKPSGQRILTREGGDRSASRDRDCQHRGGRGPGARGMANPGEPPQAS